LKRQEAAARQFAEIRKAKANLAEKLDTLERIPAALLREAFNGKVASAETERVEA
jgi:hypothetical protein